jgi:hypothetical protein
MKGVIFYAAYTVIVMVLGVFLSNSWSGSKSYELPPPPPVIQTQD